MKTITLDFETYEKELKTEFVKGETQGTLALPEAKELLIKVSNKDWYTGNLEKDIWNWVAKYCKD